MIGKMADVELKGKIKTMNINEGTLKLSMELPVDEPSITFLVPLLNKQISMIFTDHQTQLPVDEEE